MRAPLALIAAGIGFLSVLIAFDVGRHYEEQKMLSAAGRACADVISKRWPQ